MLVQNTQTGEIVNTGNLPPWTLHCENGRWSIRARAFQGHDVHPISERNARRIQIDPEIVEALDQNWETAEVWSSTTTQGR